MTAVSAALHYSFSYLAPDFSPDLTRHGRYDAKESCRLLQVTLIKGSQKIGATVDGSLQHHLIRWVLQLRSPQKSHLNRNGRRQNSVEYCFRLLGGHARLSEQMRPSDHCFVLHGERHRNEHCDATLQPSDQKFPG